MKTNAVRRSELLVRHAHILLNCWYGSATFYWTRLVVIEYKTWVIDDPKYTANGRCKSNFPWKIDNEVITVLQNNTSWNRIELNVNFKFNSLERKRFKSRKGKYAYFVVSWIKTRVLKGQWHFINLYKYIVLPATYKWSEEHLSSPPLFSGVRVAWSLVFYATLYVMFYRSLFVLFLFLLVIAVSVYLRFTVSDYPFGIFKLFLEIKTCQH